MLHNLISKVKQWKKELILSIALYVIGIILGIIAFHFAFPTSQDFRNFVNNLYPDLESQKGHLTFWHTFAMIYERNVTAAGITVLLGLIYRYLPLIIVFYNGLILGLVTIGVAYLGVPLLAILGSILPHGIFEIPAMLIAGALGIHLSYIGKGLKGRLKALTQSQNAILLILVLLFIAALIESELITLIGG